MAQPQLNLSAWLDDQNGPAKLTTHQLRMVADLNQTGGDSEAKLTQSSSFSADNHHQHHHQQQQSPHQQVVSQRHLSKPTTQVGHDGHSDILIKLLAPRWEPNEIINMFYEERQKIIDRGDECKNLLAKTDSVLNEIIALKNLYLYVSPKTSQLHSECKNIIQEKINLKDSYDKINSTLNRQEELRSIFRRMPDIKNQILMVLNSVCQGYQKRLAQEATPLDEYYGRFFIECRRIKELTSQLESCLSTSNTDELLLHLEEIYTLYFDIREQLIEPVFTKNIRTLISKADRNYCDLLQQTSTSLVRILRNEIQLFNQIFPPAQATPESPTIQTTTTTSNSTSSTVDVPQQHQEEKRVQSQPVKKQAMNNFLDLLCKTFYEHLRPVVIHVNHLETLTELHKLVVETMRPEVAEEGYKLTMSNLAEDIQERMVYRTEVFIQESILDYKPSSGDLAYPEKFEIVTSGEFKDFQSMWYPTVQRTVLALVFLNRVFDPITFKELAREVVTACLQSLDLAKKLIDERHNGAKIEADMFLDKHLAIIRDQLQLYGIHVVPGLPPMD